MLYNPEMTNRILIHLPFFVLFDSLVAEKQKRKQSTEGTPLSLTQAQVSV